MKKGLVILFALVTMFSLKAQDEYQAKAFFIYNFTRLIEWPADNSQEFVIGVVGESPIFDKLTQLTSNKKAGNKQIVVKKFNSAQEVKGCEIIYIAQSASKLLSEIERTATNQNTLIVGEQKGMTDKGAAINFILNNNRLSFNINVNNAQKNGLKVSKSLVDMAS